MTDTRRRVKMYSLNAEKQWADKGTGHVSAAYVDHLEGISLMVRDERDGALLLESKIQFDTAYVKQQETLIIWSEGDNSELALSFQEKMGCEEIWEKICQVQEKDPALNYTQEESEDDSISSSPVVLPPCELGHLEEINEILGSNLNNPMWKERMATAIESNDYIMKLLNLFHMCEDLENLDGLHYLYTIFKSIFLLNKIALFEVMFSEETIFDVIGCLEYDPSHPTPKKHRKYLKQFATFKVVVPITNPELVAKIHQTYRVQYIQDVVLPMLSLFEDNLLSSLSSFIYFNKTEIVTKIHQEEKLLNELFTLLASETTDNVKRRDLILFLKEFCEFSQNVQVSTKEVFYKTLYTLGILAALEVTLVSEDLKIRCTSVDILACFVEFSPGLAREYILQQAVRPDKDQLLINILINQAMFNTNEELDVTMQLIAVLKILLDPGNMLTSITASSEKSDFLNYFYKYCMHIITAPLLANTAGLQAAKDDNQTVQLLSVILELLSFCVENHSYHIKHYMIKKDLMQRILMLTKSRHVFLVLCAIRFMRKTINLKDEVYNKYIVRGHLFEPILDIFTRNNGRYNLLDSAILEMFEFMRSENIKTLCSHVVLTYKKIFNDYDHIQTFKALKFKYGEHAISQESIYQNQYQMDVDEEMWFDDDDDEIEEDENVRPAERMYRKRHTNFNSICKSADGNSSKGKNSGSSLLSSVSGDAKSAAIVKKSLVDYEGDSDDEDDGSDVLLPSLKHARM